jgi:hypothetical protein
MSFPNRILFNFNFSNYIFHFFKKFFIGFVVSNNLNVALDFKTLLESVADNLAVIEEAVGDGSTTGSIINTDITNAWITLF